MQFRDKKGIGYQFDNLSEDAYIRQKELIEWIVPFSSSTLWRMVSAGEFPKPIKLSLGITAWRVSDVRRWLADPSGFKANSIDLEEIKNAFSFGGAV